MDYSGENAERGRGRVQSRKGSCERHREHAPSRPGLKRSAGFERKNGQISMHPSKGKLNTGVKHLVDGCDFYKSENRI